MKLDLYNTERPFNSEYILASEGITKQRMKA